MKNIKQYIPILVFVVTLVLSGVTILTSKELEKRKYIPPQTSLADNGIYAGPNCNGTDVSYQGDPKGNPVASGGTSWCTSPAQSPDPSTRPPGGGTPPTSCEGQGSCSGCTHYNNCSTDFSGISECKSTGHAGGCSWEEHPSGGTCVGQYCSYACERNGNQGDCQNSGCTWTPKVCTTPTPTPTSPPSNTPTPTSSLTPTPTRTITLTSTPTVTPTGTLTPTVTPTVTPTGTLTPTVSPSPTPPGTFSHNVCVDRSCVSQLCSPSTQPCNSTCSGEVDCNSRLVCVNNACKRVVGSGTDECQSDVNCQPLAVTPKVPTSATTTPTILSIIGGVALLLGGILLAL